MNLSSDAKILDRIKYAIAELQEAEKLFVLSTEPTAEGHLPSIPEMEKDLITVTFHKFKGHRGNMAKSLGISEKVVTDRLRMYGLVRKRDAKAKYPATDFPSIENSQDSVHRD